MRPLDDYVSGKKSPTTDYLTPEYLESPVLQESLHFLYAFPSVKTFGSETFMTKGLNA